MGIREYFKQHPESEDLKIQNLNIKTEQNPDELFIDPEKEITEEDWQEILKEIEEFRQEINNQFKREVSPQHLMNYLNLMINLSILFPEKSDQIKMEDNIWQFINEHLDQCDEILYVKFLGYIKILWPDKFSELIINQNKIKKAFKDINFQGNYTDIIYGLLPYVVIFAKLKQRFSDNVLKQIEDFFSRTSNLEKQNNPKYLSILRLFFPDEFKDININQEQWQFFKKTFQRQKEENLWQYNLNQLMMYKIIAAKEVRVSDQGFEFIMPTKSLKVEKSKRPERRSF